jgi:hypothetical protein
MKEFRVALSRAYAVTVEAESEEQACRMTEYYLGDFPDLSTSEDRENKGFKINEIEMTKNDAIVIEADNPNGHADLSLWSNDKIA